MQDVFEKYTDPETYKKIVTYRNLTEMWESSVSAYPQNVAMVDGGVSVTYAEFNALVARFRTVLVREGAVGGLVGILCPNSSDFAKAFLAAGTLGVPTVLLPAHLDAMTVFGCAMGFGLKAIVYDESLGDKLEVLRAKNAPLALIPADCDGDGETPSVSVPSESLCTVLFTGGTTGKSKGAKLSHRAVMAGVRNGCYGIKKIFEERYLLVLPLTHVFGLIRNLLTCFYTGSAIYICRSNKDMFRDAAVFRPTVMVMVPALAEMALNLSRQFGKWMLGEDLKTVICGAAPVPPYLVQEYAKRGIALLPGYGLTESANLVSGNPEALSHPESVGLVYPGMELKFVDGEIWLKGENMMDGYVGGEENETAYEDGWFKTGDLGHMDEDGFLTITGRKKEIIVLGTGENVSPAEVEVKFLALDGVQDCLVYDTVEGGRQILVLEILPRMTALKEKGVTDAEAYLRKEAQKINETLPSFERIGKIILRDTDFVRTPAMKIARNLNGNAKK